MHTLSEENNPEPRPKFLELNFERIGRFPVNIRSEELGNQNACSATGDKFSAKLNLPVVMKKDLTVVMGLRYSRQEYEFRKVDPTDLPIHYRFDEREMSSFGYRLYIKKKFDNNISLNAGFGADLNGDMIELNNFSHYFSHNYFGVISKEKNKYTNYGIGFAFGYTMGLPQVYPILAYTHVFSPRWKTELYLPKKISFRYTASPKMYLTATTEVAGARYYLRDKVLDNYDALVFRQSEVRASLSFEREIHDWLWLEVQAGGLHTIRTSFTTPEARRSRDNVFNIKSFATPFVNFSVFLVPPRKLMAKSKM